MSAPEPVWPITEEERFVQRALERMHRAILKRVGRRVLRAEKLPGHIGQSEAALLEAAERYERGGVGTDELVGACQGYIANWDRFAKQERVGIAL